MTTFARIILIICIVTLVQIHLVEEIHLKGKQLAYLANLPHRSLGALYWAHMLAPEREDFAYDYAMEWLLCDNQERLLEGQRRPVVPMYIITLANKFPKDPDFQKMKYVIMKEHLSGKSKFVYPKEEK